MSQQNDVPTALRNAITTIGIEKRIANSVQDFIADCIDTESVSLMYQDLRQLYIDDDRLDAKHKSKVLPAYSLDAFIYLYLEALRVNNKLPKAQDRRVWSRGVNSICLIEGDLFAFGFGNRKNQKAIVVIPVNTGFDTHITWKKEQADYPLVSDQTLHGAWLRRWEDAGNSLEELGQDINAQLSKVPVNEHGAFPYGTIVAMDSEKAVYYLLAISEFDAENRAQSNPGMIRQSVIALLKHYDKYGQGYPLYLPLLGTGRSRAALSYVESYALISETMVEHCQYAQGKIFIVATEEAMKEIETAIGGNL